MIESLQELILYENDDFIVINKPQGVVVNKSLTSADKTISELTKDYLNLVKPKNFLNSSLNDQEFYDRNGVVHRLDKETNGVLLIAKNPASYTELKNQFLKRKIKKEYHAVCFNDISNFFNGKQTLLINLPLIRDPKNRHQFAVSKMGRDAVSKVTLLLDYNNKSVKNGVGYVDGQYYSFVKVLPKTGRTHQIRVHLKALNSEIVGDDVYNGRGQKKINEKYNLRLCLIAKKLDFKVFDKEYSFEVPYNENFDRAVRELLLSTKT